jgi:hypothetical protein
MQPLPSAETHLGHASDDVEYFQYLYYYNYYYYVLRSIQQQGAKSERQQLSGCGTERLLPWMLVAQMSSS